MTDEPFVASELATLGAQPVRIGKGSKVHWNLVSGSTVFCGKATARSWLSATDLPVTCVRCLQIAESELRSIVD